MSGAAPNPAWIEAARRLGRDAAHGIADRGSLEICARYWCRKDPTLRGSGVAILCHFYEQAERVELERVELAMLYVRRAVWAMFEARAPRGDVIAAAVAANDGVLISGELDALLADICPRATRRRA